MPASLQGLLFSSLAGPKAALTQVLVVPELDVSCNSLPLRATGYGVVPLSVTLLLADWTLAIYGEDWTAQSVLG